MVIWVEPSRLSPSFSYNFIGVLFFSFLKLYVGVFLLLQFYWCCVFLFPQIMWQAHPLPLISGLCAPEAAPLTYPSCRAQKAERTNAIPICADPPRSKKSHTMSSFPRPAALTSITMPILETPSPRKMFASSSPLLPTIPFSSQWSLRPSTTGTPNTFFQQFLLHTIHLSTCTTRKAYPIQQHKGCLKMSFVSPRTATMKIGTLLLRLTCSLAHQACPALPPSQHFCPPLTPSTLFVGSLSVYLPCPPPLFVSTLLPCSWLQHPSPTPQGPSWWALHLCEKGVSANVCL